MLTTYAGQYLPNSIRAQFVTAQDISRWLEANGEPVRATSTTDRYARALTWSGFHVYRNGYVAALCTDPEPGME